MSSRKLCFIYKVPGELIAKFFDHLLPELLDTGVLRYPIAWQEDDISDLCRCRLVCRMFYDIASPFVWRRISLVLPGYRASSPDAVSAANTQYILSRFSDITQFMARNSTITQSVRLITLSSHPSYYYYDVSTTTRGLGVASALSTVIPMLTNLRVLSLKGVSSQFIVDLMILSPSLRVVRLIGVDCSSLSVDRSMVNHSIRQLGIHRCKKAERLYTIMPSLTAFDGEVNPSVTTWLPLWIHLREVSFQADIPVWDEIARSFMVCRAPEKPRDPYYKDTNLMILSQTWRHVRRHLPFSLRELMICQWHFNPKIKDLVPIIKSFAGNPLTKLVLFYVDDPTASHVEQIVHIFPRLVELSLLSDEELAHWPSNLVAYGNAFGKLQSLRLLEWNYYDAEDHRVYGNWNMVSEERLVEIALFLAENCNSLKRVHFCLFIDGLMGLNIFRDGGGGAEVLPPLYVDSWNYCTSAWTRRNFEDI